MILKFFQLNKINLSNNKFLLFYGKNNGLINEEVSKYKSKFKVVEKYDEKEIFENIEKFFQNILTSSLFEKDKCIIINNGSDQ